MWDVVVGNPPFGMRVKGSSATLHLKIMKNSLSVCRDFLCLIMPSKPLIRQLTGEWYDMFRNAVCTQVDVVGQETFPGTDMDKTAIYFCDRKADKKDLCRKFDIDRRVYEMIDDEGHRLFIDKMGKMEQLKIDITIEKGYDLSSRVKKDSMYLNVNRVGIKPGYGEQIYMSGYLKTLPVMTGERIIEFYKTNMARRNILFCPSYEYGVNLKKLFCESLVFRYGLWLTQIAQYIYYEQFKYIPSLDYSKIDNDLDLLLACGFTREEADTVLTYLSGFDFTQNRNDMVRDLP